MLPLHNVIKITRIVLPMAHAITSDHHYLEVLIHLWAVTFQPSTVMVSHSLFCTFFLSFFLSFFLYIYIYIYIYIIDTHNSLKHLKIGRGKDRDYMLYIYLSVYCLLFISLSLSLSLSIYIYIYISVCVCVCVCVFLWVFIIWLNKRNEVVSKYRHEKIPTKIHTHTYIHTHTKKTSQDKWK